MNADELVAALESRTGEEFLVELSTRIYQPPLSQLRQECLADLPPALRVPMLAIAFNTELHMSGLLGFLGTPSGAWLDETIDALAAIGAHATAETVLSIRAILARHGVDPSDREGISRFYWDHWEESDALNAEIHEAERALYGYSRPHGGEDVLGMLQKYVDDSRGALLDAIRTCAGQGVQ